MRLTFIGAAQEVTGSCFLVESDGLRFLVDCGMFQGGREARQRNLTAWPFDPRQVDFVLLTHAHTDHSGLLPRLCALGFRGPIFTTHATVDLLSVMLLVWAASCEDVAPRCANACLLPASTRSTRRPTDWARWSC